MTEMEIQIDEKNAKNEIAGSHFMYDCYAF